MENPFIEIADRTSVAPEQAKMLVSKAAPSPSYDFQLEFYNPETKAGRCLKFQSSSRWKQLSSTMQRIVRRKPWKIYWRFMLGTTTSLQHNRQKLLQIKRGCKHNVRETVERRRVSLLFAEVFVLKARQVKLR